MEPIILTALTTLGLLFCGFLIGRHFQQSNQDDMIRIAIGSTIDNLVRDGYLAMDVDENGEPTILTIDVVVKKAVDQAPKV